MKNSKKYLYTIFISSIFFSAYSQNKDAIVSKKINQIHSHFSKIFGKRLLDEHLAGIFPSDKNFRYLCEKPESFENQLLKILGGKGTSLEKKYIALYALQYQCEEKYSTILSKIYNLFLRGLINERLLISAIRQDDFSLEVIKNSYNSDRLKKLLQRISIDQKVSAENLNWIAEIQTIDYYKSLKEDLDQVGEKPYECK
jgi:hypothetical protein